MKRKRSIAIVGPGSLGSAVATSLSRAGYRIAEIITRAGPASQRRAARLARNLGARVSTINRPLLLANIVWICVPDSQIGSVADRLSRTGKWADKFVFHSSGALSSDELRPLRREGAKVASVHPMMSFVRGVTPSLQQVPFAVEGDAASVTAARQIVRSLGGNPFVIAKKNKAAYHAWGAFASPLLIAALVTGERVAHAAGISGTLARKNMLPIIRQTIQNYAERGGAGAFSGPLIRGDAATVRKHLHVLSKVPGALDVYVALARSALRDLPSRDRASLLKILS